MLPVSRFWRLSLIVKLVKLMKFLIRSNKFYSRKAVLNKKTDLFYFFSKRSMKSFLSLLDLFSSISMRTGSYVAELMVIGVGFKFLPFRKRILQLSLGYSHDIFVFVPPEVSFHVFKHYLALFSYNKALATQIASTVRSLRLPDSYKGKGIRYLEEIVKLKKGKQKQR